ncbi:GvpL/GvpF family gas vesicle protein [Streptomyces sp. NPDC102274]|uniref:GvpL/GvpF family gas vesicle protein n=1 Tax=Streptomyces sp. NPDC102274 TaxID=3366151 RepID=UPI0038145139
MTGNGVYVYAIVRAGQRAPAELSGVGSPPLPLRVLVEGRLGAVVSDAPPKLRARRRDLLAHQDVLLWLTGSGPTLPMRFGMVAPDEEAVRSELTAAEHRHHTVLKRLDGRVEVNVKAFVPSDALAPLVQEDKNIQRLHEAARRHPGYEANLRLGEAVATALSRRAAEAGQRAVQELTPLAHAVAAGPQVPGCVLNTSFLIDSAADGRFRAAAQDFAALRQDRVELRVAGPLPCYSFVEAGGALAGAGA